MLEIEVHVDPERYSVAEQLDDAVQTSAAPVPLEVAPTAQAHTASADAVAAVFAYVDPVLQTVAVDAHCDTGEDDERVVDVAW